MSPRKQAKESELSESRWQRLYQSAGAAALLVAILIVVQIFVSFLSPPPAISLEAFRLFQNNWLLGFLANGLLTVIGGVLVVPVLLALYIALRKTGEPSMLIGATLGLHWGNLSDQFQPGGRPAVPQRSICCCSHRSSARHPPGCRGGPAGWRDRYGLACGLCAWMHCPGDHFDCHTEGQALQSDHRDGRNPGRVPGVGLLRT